MSTSYICNLFSVTISIYLRIFLFKLGVCSNYIFVSPSYNIFLPRQCEYFSKQKYKLTYLYHQKKNKVSQHFEVNVVNSCLRT